MRNLAISLLAIPFILAGCAKEFPLQTYTQQETEYVNMLKSSDDVSSRTELARLYFEHNELEKADSLLEKLAAENKDNAEVLAWYGANNCKIAGKKGPWLLGIDKIFLAKACLQQIQDALKKDSENFTIQMIALHTGAAVNAFDSLNMARAEMQKIAGDITKKSDAYTPAALFNYHYASALVELAAENRDAAKEHLTKANSFEVNPSQKQLVQQQLDKLK